MDIKQQLRNPPIWEASLNERPELVEELIDWLKEKDISIRQTIGLLNVTKVLVEEAWRMEEKHVKF